MPLYRYRGVRAAEPDTLIIWRYMDWWKFKSMVETGGLFFSRADIQEDPWDGRATDFPLEHLKALTWDGKPVALDEFLRQGDTSAGEFETQRKKAHDSTRRFGLLNCWHVHPTESLRMWEAYTSEPSAVAIQTTVGDLKHCLDKSPSKLYLGFVSYIAKDEAHLPLDGLLLPFFRKDPDLAFERELRALCWNCPSQNLNVVDQDAYDKTFPNGGLLRVDLSRLIQSVRLLPNAPPDLQSEAIDMLRRAGLEKVDVQTSALPFGPPAAVRRAISDAAKGTEIRNVLGNRGLLGIEEYDIAIDDRFHDNYVLHRLSDEEALEAVQRASKAEFLAPSLDRPGNISNYILFLQPVHKAPPSRSYSVITMARRTGAGTEDWGRSGPLADLRGIPV